MGNRILNPHEMGVHSIACMRKAGCVLGIKMSHSRPWLLDTKKKVAFANKIRKELGGNLLDQAPWKLGDHCWYTKK